MISKESQALPVAGFLGILGGMLNLKRLNLIRCTGCKLLSVEDSVLSGKGSKLSQEDGVGEFILTLSLPPEGVCSGEQLGSLSV